jgi:hypothetical protein
MAYYHKSFLFAKWFEVEGSWSKILQQQKKFKEITKNVVTTHTLFL